jgi:ribulose-phosphate 3-epimerase
VSAGPRGAAGLQSPAVPGPTLTERHVLPSLMFADLLRIGEQVDALIAAGARLFHVDVMDGRFVPNLALGTAFAAAVAVPVHAAGGLVDVHLMVERPGPTIDLFADAADAISVHVEADPHPHRLLRRIREAGCRAGLAINPGTPVAALEELLTELDYVNCMSVDPGFSGQEFIATTPPKLTRLRERLPSGVALEVDGGVDVDSLLLARAAGANLFACASAIFGASDPAAAYRTLAALAASADEVGA